MARFILTAILVLCSCTREDHAARQQHADDIAARGRMHYRPWHTASFGLTGYQRPLARHEAVTVYIEGDGYAWVASDVPSRDPTPLAPIALELAARDPSSNVVYLARPCQYGERASPRCDERYWTSARFSPEVIQSYDAVLTQLKATAAPPGFHLVGFSGGGAVALLLASGRQDVLSVRTIAGNIDHKAWTQLHDISPLGASLNAADRTESLASIPQLHFVGADDAVMPIAVAETYRQRFRDRRCVRIVTVPGAAHTTGWTQQWQKLRHTPLPCQAGDGSIRQ